MNKLLKFSLILIVIMVSGVYAGEGHDKKNFGLTPEQTQDLFKTFLDGVRYAKNGATMVLNNQEYFLMFPLCVARYQLHKMQREKRYKQLAQMKFELQTDGLAVASELDLYNNSDDLNKNLSDEANQYLQRNQFLKDLQGKMEYSQSFRSMAEGTGQGLEVANGVNFVVKFLPSDVYSNIPKVYTKDRDHETEYDPYVRYLETAAAHNDAKQLREGFATILNYTPAKKVTCQVSSYASYPIKRLADGAVSLVVTNTKAKYLSPEEILIPRGLEYSARFAKEFGPQDPISKTATQSVIEAGQRVPYRIMLERSTGCRFTQKQTGLDEALQIGREVGLDAAVRFGFAMTEEALAQSEGGANLLKQRDECVPREIQTIGKEVAVAGAITMGKHCAKQDCLIL